MGLVVVAVPIHRQIAPAAFNTRMTVAQLTNQLAHPLQMESFQPHPTHMVYIPSHWFNNGKVTTPWRRRNWRRKKTQKCACGACSWWVLPVVGHVPWPRVWHWRRSVWSCSTFESNSRIESWTCWLIETWWGKTSKAIALWITLHFILLAYLGLLIQKTWNACHRQRLR